MLLRARRYFAKTREERAGFYDKLRALNETIRKPEAAKDIRIYGANEWLGGLYRSYYKQHRNAERKVLSKNMHAQLVDAFLILIRDGAAYAFLIWLVINNQMTLGDFVFIFAAIGALAGWVTGILTASADLARACIEMDDCVVALDFADKMNTGVGVPLPSGKDLPPSIELKGVGYTYPGSDKPALKDINVSIQAGEKIAIVGANGAGKSTLVKLICGLYLPTEGEILLNGLPIKSYNRDDYYKLFSAVFQDIHMLSVSIAENISQQTFENTDFDKVMQSIKHVGLTEKLNSLPDKENTLLVRAVNPDATELSGGEKQKLAMARAIYKDAPVLILDEPTAALDPIAENEVYLKYAELTEGKTSVYISHRLASTRFCDRILLLDGSELTEEGSHDELMAIDGTYANMFMVQASYYQEGVEF
jgi:ABC-type multidrug transport system fused ATPase/permease subunit